MTDLLNAYLNKRVVKLIEECSLKCSSESGVVRESILSQYADKIINIVKEIK